MEACSVAQADNIHAQDNGNPLGERISLTLERANFFLEVMAFFFFPFERFPELTIPELIRRSRWHGACECTGGEITVIPERQKRPW